MDRTLHSSIIDNTGTSIYPTGSKPSTPSLTWRKSSSGYDDEEDSSSEFGTNYDHGGGHSHGYRTIGPVKKASLIHILDIKKYGDALLTFLSDGTIQVY
jgi:hypothetical protein